MASYRVGLTGGIGAGKSTVLRLFKQLGVPAIEADDIARNLAEPGQAAFEAIVRQFGRGILRNGHIDRRRLRQCVFADAGARQQLEAILHPLVYQELDRWASKTAAPYCLLGIPLLLETAPSRFVDRVLVVDCSADLQIQRVGSRDGIADAEVQRIIAAQTSRANRRRAADDLIENDGTMDDLRHRVAGLHAQYLERASALAPRDRPASESAGPSLD